MRLSRNDLDAVIFDMDGVVTDTAKVHALAWKRLFDEVLAARTPPGNRFRPFEIESDYHRYVDGKLRQDGVADFLASRGVRLPLGNAEDPLEAGTVHGLGNRKDAYFQGLLLERGVDVFPSTIDLLRSLRQVGVKTGIFSASRHAVEVLSAARALELFDAKVDGDDARALGLPGKPSPAMLLELAARLGVTPARTAVVEDAEAGVRAGRAGGFRVVIGVNRRPPAGRLIANGADAEVSDLSEVQVTA